MSSTGALSLKKVPKNMVVIGAGVIGMELVCSQLFLTGLPPLDFYWCLIWALYPLIIDQFVRTVIFSDFDRRRGRPLNNVDPITFNTPVFGSEYWNYLAVRLTCTTIYESTGYTSCI